MIPIMRAVGGVANRLLIKRPAAKLSLGDLASKLEDSGKVLEGRYGAALDSEKNRQTLRHVTGMERWGQRRLEVFLGKDMVTDEYDGYQPSANASWRDLKLAFANTRRNTVALARQLAKADVPADRTVARVDHDDDLGALLQTSVSGELQPLTARSVRAAFFGMPMMTLGVIARIHWQALRLWTQRVGFRSKPMPPPAPIPPAPAP